MADTTYAVKLPEEVQERIKQLVADSGSSNKDFITNLIAQFELEQVKAHTPIISQDIAEIQQLTKRIDNIFVGIGERIGTLQTNHVNEIEERTATSKDTIQLLQQRINTLEHDKLEDEERIKSFISDKEAAELKVHELQQQVKQLEDINKKNDTIILEYRQKIDDLSSIVSEYKAAAEENKELHQRVNTLQQDKDKQAQQLDSLKNNISELESQQEAISTKHNKELSEALENQRDRINLEHDKAIMILKQELQNKLEAYQDKHVIKINEYEEKVQQLLLQLESPANRTARTPKSKEPTVKEKV